jgi:shikimate kinase
MKAWDNQPGRWQVNPSTLHMLIVFIGYRGTGKTSVARALSRRLGWDWTDLDDEIERAAGKSVAAIFAESGEAAFRDEESRQLARFAQKQQFLLAAGGGVILRPENRQRLLDISRRGGKVIWLQAESATLWRRLSQDAATDSRRPRLTTASGLEEIIQLLKERAPFYAQCADAVINTEAKTPDQVEAEVLQLLNIAPS